MMPNKQFNSPASGAFAIKATPWKRATRPNDLVRRSIPMWSAKTIVRIDTCVAETRTRGYEEFTIYTCLSITRDTNLNYNDLQTPLTLWPSMYMLDECLDINNR